MKSSLLALLVAMFGLGCSSDNLNSFRTEWTGGWVKMSPMDVYTPGKIELGMGYGSLSIIPIARGQGVKYTAITYELISGHPLFVEEITVYPVDKDSILRLEQYPESIFKVPWLDIKAGASNAINPKIEVIPVEGSK